MSSVILSLDFGLLVQTWAGMYVLLTHALDIDVVYHSEEIGRLSRQQEEASGGIV